MSPRHTGTASRSQVARRLGVSEAAVYAALTDRKTTICLTDDTRERIRRVAKEMGYEPSVLARSLVSRKSFLVSLLARNPIQPIVVQVMEGAQNYLHDRDYSLLTYYHGIMASDEAEHLRRSVRRKVDGIITYPALDQDGTTNAETYRQITRQGTPLVQIGHAVAPDLPAVVLDLAAAGSMAVEQLWQQGHRRVAILVHDQYDKEPAPGFYGDVVPLLAGYEAAMKAHSLQPIVITRPMHEGLATGKISCIMVNQAVETTAAKILSHPAKPTAILAVSENEATSLIIALDRLGVNVPRQMSVLARFAHSVTEGGYEQMSLTGVGFESEKLGETAASRVFSAIEKTAANAPARTMIPPVTVAGKTVARHSA